MTKDEAEVGGPVRADPGVEIKAMAKIAEALNPLPEDSITRVLRWANDHYKAPAERTRGAISSGVGDAAASHDRPISEYSDLPDFYSACNPGTDSEKALVVGYWFQFREGAVDFDTQRVNTELKHLGYQIGNITRAFDNLESMQPRLVVQVRKLGSAKQSRKRLKLTVEGKKAVEQMLAGSSAA